MRRKAIGDQSLQQGAGSVTTQSIIKLHGQAKGNSYSG